MNLYAVTKDRLFHNAATTTASTVYCLTDAIAQTMLRKENTGESFEMMNNALSVKHFIDLRKAVGELDCQKQKDSKS